MSTATAVVERVVMRSFVWLEDRYSQIVWNFWGDTATAVVTCMRTICSGNYEAVVEDGMFYYLEVLKMITYIILNYETYVY